MAKRKSLQGMKDKITQELQGKDNNTDGYYYPHWKLLKDGKTVLRISEDPDMGNELDCYIDYLEHKVQIDDKWVRVPCLKNNGKSTPCPFCEHSKKMYDADNKKLGKYYWREAFAILRGIVIEDGLEAIEGHESKVGKEVNFKFTHQLNMVLKNGVKKLEDDEIFFDLKTGINFEIVKVIQKDGDKEYGKYDVSSDFARRASDVSEYADAQTDQPLSTLIPPTPTYDEASEILERHLRGLDSSTAYSGGSQDEDEGEEQQSSQSDLEAQINRRRSSKKDEEPAKTESADPVIDADADDNVGDVPEDADASGIDELIGEGSSDDDDDDDILKQLGG